VRPDYRKIRPQPFEVVWRLGDRLVKQETHSPRQAFDAATKLRQAGIDASVYLGNLEIALEALKVTA